MFSIAFYSIHGKGRSNYDTLLEKILGVISGLWPVSVPTAALLAAIGFRVLGAL